MAAGDIVPVPGAQFEETLASVSSDLLRAMIREPAQRIWTPMSRWRAMWGTGGSRRTGPPGEVWRQIWSNNPQEWLNKEVRRRTDVVGIILGRAAIIRLVGAVLAEQNDEWTASGRYMGLEILAACRKAARPLP